MKSPRSIKQAILALVFFTLASSVVLAQSTWTGSSPGFWNTAANWDPSGVPGAGASIVLNNGGASGITININTAPAVLNNWTTAANSGGNVNIIPSTSARSLTIGGTLTKTGTNILVFRPNSGVALSMTVGTLDLTAASAGAVGFGNVALAGTNALTSLFITNANVSSSSGTNQLNFLDAANATNYTVGTLTLGTGGEVALANGSTNPSTQYFLNVGSLNGSAGVIRAANGSNNLTGSTATLNLIGTSNGTFGGTIVDNNVATNIKTALSKSGAATQTLTGTNTYSGATTVAAGRLVLDTTGGDALKNTASLTVSGGVLLIAKSDQIENSATVTLSGGTIAKGSGAISETFGALNLTDTSFLDFGSGTGNFTFASYAPGSFKLTFQNFNMGNSLTITNGTYTASEFDFNGFGTSFAAVPTGGFTITAVPEPSTVLAALGLTGLLLWPLRRRYLGQAKP